MRRLAGMLVALALLAAAVHWLRADGRPAATTVDPGRPTAARAPDPAGLDSPETREGPPPLATDAAREARREALVEAPSEAGPAGECIVHGAVVDEHDAPLAGVAVRLAAYRAWADGADVPRLPGPYDHRGWEVPTDEAGRFRFVVPPPTVARQWLSIEPDDFHDSARVFFGEGDPRDFPGLAAGELDVGTFRLATTGAIRGLVTDEAGRPIEGVRLNVGPEPSVTYGREGTSDADGRYLIAHVQPGTYGVQTRAEGWLTSFRKPFEVEANRTTDGADFVLRRAPSISGRVRGEDGEPLEGVRLWGWPASSGSGAGARTAADGSFTMYLPQDEPYTLEATLEGYSGFGVGDRTTHYASGTTGIEIVLGRGTLTRFVVVDAATGAAVERFGLRVVKRRNVSYGSPPRIEAHPGGEVELDAVPDADRFELVADGYAEVSGMVAHDEPGSNVMTLALGRGLSVSGRVVRDGTPVAGVDVRLLAGTLTTMRGPDGARPPEPRFRVLRDARVVTATTDERGRFELIGLDAGLYRLEARADGGAPAIVEPLTIRRESLDVGDVLLEPGATILGRLLPPPDVEAGGLTVFLDDWRDGVKTVTDAGGAFRFDDVPRGDHELTADDVPGKLAAVTEAVPALAPGEERVVTLDATGHGVCDVTLRILLGEDEVEGLRVALQAVASHDEYLNLGPTDADGRATGSVRAAGDARVQVTTPAVTRLVHPSAIVPLVVGTRQEATVRYEVASLSLRLPSGVELPAEGRANLQLDPRGGEEPAWARVGLGAGVSHAPSELRLADDGRVLVFEHLPPGTYAMTFQLVDSTAPLEQTPVEGGGVRVGPRPSWTAEREVELRAGENVLVELP